MNTSVRSVREMPAEWPALQEVAADILSGGSQQPTVGQACVLWDHTSELGDERLVANLYYADGLVLCDLYRHIQDKTVYNTVVDSIAQSTTDMFVRGKTLGLCSVRAEPSFDNLGTERIASGMRDLAHLALANMEPPTRFLGDTLTGIAVQRMIAQDRLQRGKGDGTVGDFARKLALQRIADRNEMSRILGANAYVGALRILELAIKKSNIVEASTPLREVVASGILSSPESLRKVARATAQLRIDEFNSYSYVEALVSKNDKGELIFDTAILGMPPPKEHVPSDQGVETLPSIHYERHTCPALQIRGLIPLMLRLVADVYTKTSERYDTLPNARW